MSKQYNACNWRFVTRWTFFNSRFIGRDEFCRESSVLTFALSFHLEGTWLTLFVFLFSAGSCVKIDQGKEKSSCVVRGLIMSLLRKAGFPGRETCQIRRISTVDNERLIKLLNQLHYDTIFYSLLLKFYILVLSRYYNAVYFS